MTTATLSLYQTAADGAAARLRDWLTGWSIQELADRFQVADATAAAWRAGRNPPGFRHLTAMVQVWGSGFLDHVFGPVVAGRPADPLRQLHEINQQIAALRETLAAREKARHGQAGALGGGAAGVAAAVGRVEGGAGGADCLRPGRAVVQVGAAALAALSLWSALDGSAMATTRPPRPPVTMRAPIGKSREA